MMIIDRFEGDFAVIEYEGKTFNLHRALLPTGAKEGDVIKITVSIDNKKTKKRREKVKDLVDEVFE